MLKIRNFAFLVALSTLAFAQSSFAAAPIDGYIGPRIDLVNSLSDEGSHKRINAEFGRISKIIQFDAFIGTGDYTDYGFLLKLYNHWVLFDGRMGSTGISAGAGLGASYIPDLAPNTAGEQKFWDLLVTPYVRALYDTSYGVGVALDLALEIVPRRTKAKNLPDADTEIRKRFIVGLGVVFDF